MKVEKKSGLIGYEKQKNDRFVTDYNRKFHNRIEKMLEMRDESFMCSNRGIGGKVDGPSESERSFDEKWTVNSLSMKLTFYETTFRVSRFEL